VVARHEEDRPILVVLVPEAREALAGAVAGRGGCGCGEA